MMACGAQPATVCCGPRSSSASSAGWRRRGCCCRPCPTATRPSARSRSLLVADRAEGEVRPRVFFEDFPGARRSTSATSHRAAAGRACSPPTRRSPEHPVIYVAKHGRMLVDRPKRTIQMVLERRHAPQHDRTRSRWLRGASRFDRDDRVAQSRKRLPPPGPGPRRARAVDPGAAGARRRARGPRRLSPHDAMMEIHKKFSIPVACFVFALLGLALGASDRKDGKLASFVLGIGVIFIYYVDDVARRGAGEGPLCRPGWRSGCRTSSWAWPGSSRSGASPLGRPPDPHPLPCRRPLGRRIAGLWNASASARSSSRVPNLSWLRADAARPLHRR